MGEVYRACDAALKRDVAIKVLPPNWSRDPERLHRFELEAQSTAVLNHPNIVSIFHVGQHDGCPYIVTELLQGETLRDRLRRGRSYGHYIENPLVDDGVKRGLHFICLNSDIERQFEFVQQTWINNPVFGGLDGEVDPLVGDVPRGDCIFTVQDQPLRARVHGLSRFVTVKGWGVLLPSEHTSTELSSESVIPQCRPGKADVAGTRLSPQLHRERYARMTR